MVIDKKEKAKQFPIIDLYPQDDLGYLKESGKLYIGYCPFHNDTGNPNFRIYKETNTWYCFAGCGGGDSIKFIMKLKGINFVQALEKLQ